MQSSKQVRELIGQAKNSRSEKGKKSPILELSEIQSQIDKLENMLETTGMKLEKGKQGPEVGQETHSSKEEN